MKFRKKPVVIEAVQWTGDNLEELRAFVPEGVRHNRIGEPLGIKTLEGVMTVSRGDWIIKGVKGEFYPCKPDIFAATYEPMEEPAATPAEPSEAGRVSVFVCTDDRRFCERLIMPDGCRFYLLFGNWEKDDRDPDSDIEAYVEEGILRELTGEELASWLAAHPLPDHPAKGGEQNG